MTASFHASVTILLVAAVVLLAFVAANLLARLLRLETRMVAGGRDIFAALVGKKVPLEWVDSGAQATRVLLLSEDCPACRLVASEAWASATNGHRTTLAWRGRGADVEIVPKQNGVRVVHDASDIFDELGVRVTPLELWVNDKADVVAARPAMVSGRSQRAARRAVDS